MLILLEDKSNLTKEEQKLRTSNYSSEIYVLDNIRILSVDTFFIILSKFIFASF